MSFKFVPPSAEELAARGIGADAQAPKPVKKEAAAKPTPAKKPTVKDA